MENIVEVIQKAQEGDKKAMSSLVEHFTPFLKKLANQVYVQYSAVAEFDDILQGGYIGLLNGLKKYDASKDPSNGQYILNYLSTWIKEQLYLTVQYDPSTMTSSIDQENDYGVSISDILPSHEDSAEDQMIDEEQRSEKEREIRLGELDRILGELDDPRDQIVFKLRYGLVGKPRTLEQVGNILGVSHETVRKAESNAVSKVQERRVNIKYV